MSQPADILIIEVEYNTEDEDYGPVYIATNRQLHLIADGKTFEELVKNIEDAVSNILQDTDTFARYNLVPKPRLELRSDFYTD